MNFNEYQKKSWKTAIYPNKGNNFIYPALGLAGESGEICEKIKKIIRDDDGKISDNKKQLIKEEMGDLLWYIASLGVELGLDMNDIAQCNIDKLLSRKKRGALRGSGDAR